MLILTVSSIVSVIQINFSYCRYNSQHCWHILRILYGHLRFSNICWYNMLLMSLNASSFNISLTSAGDSDFRISINLLDTTGPMFSNFSDWFYICLKITPLNNCFKFFFVPAHRLEVMYSFKPLVRWSLSKNPWIDKPVFVVKALMTFVYYYLYNA